MAFLNEIATFFPKKTLDNTCLEKKFPEWTADKIKSKTGISSRFVASDSETSLDLAIGACEKLFVNIDKSQVDFILLCTQSPDYFLPSTSCIMQDKLGLSKNCGALDFNLGCSGYVYGLSIAKGLLATGIAENVLFVTAETYSKFIHAEDKSNLTIFGDGATASLISNTESNHSYGKIGKFSLGTDGSGFDKLIVKNGALRRKALSKKTSYDTYGNPISDDHLYMNGRDVFSFTLKTVPSLVTNTLLKNGMTQNDVDTFVFHQANQFMLEKLRKKIKISKDKFFISMENYGNTVSSTIPIALKDAKNKITLKNTLLAGFGVGLSWGGCMLIK